MFTKRLLDMKLYYRGILGLVGLLVQKELMDFRLVLLFFFFFYFVLEIGQIFCCQHFL